jgi:hypothetical protein
MAGFLLLSRCDAIFIIGPGEAKVELESLRSIMDSANAWTGMNRQTK